jgi:hypothetical protein
MFVRHMITTDEFTPQILEGLNQQFHAKAIRVIVLRTGLYLLRHPAIAWGSVLFFLRTMGDMAIRDAVIRLFFCRLFYRNALGRQSSFEHQLPGQHGQRWSKGRAALRGQGGSRRAAWIKSFSRRTSNVRSQDRGAGTGPAPRSS